MNRIKIIFAIGTCQLFATSCVSRQFNVAVSSLKQNATSSPLCKENESLLHFMMTGENVNLEKEKRVLLGLGLPKNLKPISPQSIPVRFDACTVDFISFDLKQIIVGKNQDFRIQLPEGDRSFRSEFNGLVFNDSRGAFNKLLMDKATGGTVQKGLRIRTAAQTEPYIVSLEQVERHATTAKHASEFVVMGSVIPGDPFRVGTDKCKNNEAFRTKTVETPNILMAADLCLFPMEGGSTGYRYLKIELTDKNPELNQTPKKVVLEKQDTLDKTKLNFDVNYHNSCDYLDLKLPDAQYTFLAKDTVGCSDLPSDFPAPDNKGSSRVHVKYKSGKKLSESLPRIHFFVFREEQ